MGFNSGLKGLISLPGRYSGLRPPACYVCNTVWGQSYTSLGLCQKKIEWERIQISTSGINSIRLTKPGVSSREFTASTVRQATNTNDPMKHTEIPKIMAWNPIYSMKTGNEMLQKIVVKNNLGNGTSTVGNKDNNVSKLWCHASSNMAYSGILYRDGWTTGCILQTDIVNP